jgi:hypothetical protein
MPQVPAVPEFLPAAPAVPVLPSRVPADLPPEGREALAAAMAGRVPGAQRRAAGKLLLPDEENPLEWDNAQMNRFTGFLRSLPDRRDRRGRRLPLDYLTAVAVLASAAGDDTPGRAAEWAASAPARLLHRLGATRDGAGNPRRPDAAAFARVLGDERHEQEIDDVLCAWPPPGPATCAPACAATCASTARSHRQSACPRSVSTARPAPACAPTRRACGRCSGGRHPCTTALAACR